MVNALFEERLSLLVDVLHSIAEALSHDGVPWELIGGLAVLVHVESVSPEHSSLTRDVDLMVSRLDLDRVKQAASRIGFHYRHAAGVDMLIPDRTDSRQYAIHLIFSEEKVRPQYLIPAPSIRPVIRKVLGKDVSVISVSDLVKMKLTSFRLKDQVHVQTLDTVGLITGEIERSLTPELVERLQQVRRSE